MTPGEISLDSLIPTGNVVTCLGPEGLSVSTTRTLPTQRFDKPHLRIRSLVALPERVRLPLRVDLAARIDVPGLYVLLGDGHVNFGTDWSDNRRLDDIAGPGYKPLYFNNYIPLNRFVTISLIYDYKEMQILVDGEERYYSKRERYMRCKDFPARNEEGFFLGIACDKGSNLLIRSLAVTEYGETAGIAPSGRELPVPAQGNPAVQAGAKPTFESCISLLPEELRQRLLRLDGELRALRPLRLRRQVEKNGNKISYVASDYGFSYAIHPSGDRMYHTLQWYILTNSKAEFWLRKANRMEEALERLHAADPEFALRMFRNLDDCVGCSKCCQVPTRYAFRGETRVACHGKLRLTMRPEDVEDGWRFIRELNELVKVVPQGQ